MKSKFNIIIVVKIILILSLYFSKLLANEIVIDAEQVDIKEKGNLIIASGKINITDGYSTVISGEKAIYDKKNENLEINGNVIFIDTSKNYKATGDKIIFNRNSNVISSFGNTEINLFDKNNIKTNFNIKGKNSIFDKDKNIIEINGNVILDDVLNNYKLFSEKIIYYKFKETIKSFDQTKINYNNNLSILANNIYFDNIKNSFFSKEKTLITDNLENKFEFSSFDFNLNNKILKAEEITLSDIDSNNIKIQNAYIDLKSNEFVGSDFIFKLNKNIFGNQENDPRLIGRYIAKNNNELKMKKSSFTTCKNTPGKCPAWSISANEVIHKKDKKRIEYKDAWLKIYDAPVAYFPYFFHPDPTVKRQSGFLFPQFINSSNLGFSTQIPYFNAIDEDKDMTISPRVYSNNNLFVQTEYRQAFKKSYLISDFSFNKKDKLNSHFFASLIGDIEDSFYEMRIETVSNSNYLKKYQIVSPLIKNTSVLNSSLLFEKNTDDYNFSSSINVIEDLSKVDSDKYEYIFPNYDFSKETFISNNIFNSLNFKSSGNYRKYNTNVDEIDMVNDLILSSNDNDKLTNLDTNLSFLVRNINTYGDLSPTYKDKSDNKLLTSALLNLKYPMIKENDTGSKFLTPLASFRYSPNKGANLINQNTLLEFQNLFELDRINNKTVENGPSMTLGIEYKNLNKFNQEKLNFGLALNFRREKDEDLPLSSSLGEKTSDLIGYSGLNITENFSINYNFLIDKNLSGTNYSLASADYSGSKFKTSFKYLEKSKLIGDESYLNNYTQLELNKSNSIAFETDKNLDKNLTNYYNLIYKYKNDCLEASLVYNKQFYNDDSVNSGQNIFFKISFVPFGTINTPALND
tara:strand:- start:7716 stop:10292 length:2577 start_codon:yes stop_codon:yes gene_type:complete